MMNTFVYIYIYIYIYIYVAYESEVRECIYVSRFGNRCIVLLACCPAAHVAERAIVIIAVVVIAVE